MSDLELRAVSRAATIRVITHVAWIGAVPVFAVLGVVGREVVLARGVPVLPRREGILLFVPLALAHELPVFLYAMLLRRACLRAFAGQATGFSGYLLAVVMPPVAVGAIAEFPRVRAAAIGSCAALVVGMGASLLGAVLASGPGGFAEVAIMLLAMLPLTLGYACVAGLVCAAIGGAVGLWIQAR